LGHPPPPPPVGQGPLIVEASRSRTFITSHSVDLLFTRDQPDVETSTWEHTTITTDRHEPCGIRTFDLSQRNIANPHFRPYGYWDRHWSIHFTENKFLSIKTTNDVSGTDQESLWHPCLIKNALYCITWYSYKVTVRCTHSHHSSLCV